jgi:glycoside/pentoside/hexuronide:cation symporter, GPH family
MDSMIARSASSTASPRAPARTLAALAAPALPMATMTLPLTIFLPAFYATTIGINLAVVGLVFTVVRLADLVFDPLVGGLMDRTLTRWGRFRPWLVIGMPVVMLGAWLLFMARPGAGAIYLAVALTLTYVGYSIVVLSQMGLSALMSPEYHERSRVFAWWQFFNMVGVFLALALPAALELIMPVTPELTVRTMGVSILVTTPLTILLAVLMVRERPAAPAPHVARFVDYLSLFRLRSARLALGSVTMTGFASGVSSAVFLFFYTIVKGVSAGTLSLVLGFFFIVTIISVPIWGKIGRRIGKHRALALGCTITALFMSLMALMPLGNLVYMVIWFGIGGFAAASADLLPRAMIADVSDEDRLATGMDRVGMLYALLSLVTKLGQATAIGAVFVVLNLLGFDAGAGRANDSGALNGVLLLGSLGPGLLHLAAAVLAWRYPLSSARHDRIRAELDRRRLPHAAEAEPAPAIA